MDQPLAGPPAKIEIPRRWSLERERLKDEIVTILKQGRGGAINLSSYPHFVTVSALRHFVYDTSYAGRKLGVTFQDGSNAAAFPIGVLTEVPHPPVAPRLQELSVGLMSFRHPEQDYIVDLYVNRNMDLVGHPTMAHEEAISFERTVELFVDPELEKGAVINVYHTGLEPMVVGFYRGVVEVLNRRLSNKLSRNLFFIPRLFHGKPTGTELSPSSPGALPENYISEQSWQ